MSSRSRNLAEARLLLRQALWLLDDHVRLAANPTTRGPLTDLTADIAHEVSIVLHGLPEPDTSEVSSQDLST